jgi:hypothetical protein
MIGHDEPVRWSLLLWSTVYSIGESAGLQTASSAREARLGSACWPRVHRRPIAAFRQSARLQQANETDEQPAGGYGSSDLKRPYFGKQFTRYFTFSVSPSQRSRFDATPEVKSRHSGFLVKSLTMSCIVLPRIGRDSRNVGFGMKAIPCAPAGMSAFRGEERKTSTKRRETGKE